jgi:hypothetical protein
LSQDAWYLGRDGKQLGPYKWAAIVQLALAKKLRATDLLWSEGMENWVTVDSYAALGFNVSDREEVAGSQDGVAAVAYEAFPRKVASAHLSEVRQSSAAPSPTGNYVARHWRGDLSLPIAYWVNGVLGTIAIVALMTAAGATDVVKTLGPHGSGAWILGVLCFAYAGTIWQCVGIWRSADRHVVRRGSAVWASVAKVMVALGLLGSFGQFVQQVPLWKQGFQLATGVDTTPSSKLQVLNRATELELSGGMSFGTADALETILRAAPTIRVVHLNSVGGYIQEGLRVGKLVESYGLTTYTERECVSACLLAFLGGKERLLGIGGRLGFHQASVAGVGGDIAKSGNDEFRELFERKGIPSTFTDKAMSTPPDKMWYPSADELMQAKVVTEVVDPSKYATVGLSAWKSREDLAAELASVPIMGALRAAEPESYSEFEAIYVDGYRDGVPQSELLAKAQTLLRDKIVPKYLKIGPDRELVRYWNSQIAEMRELRDISSELCAEFLGVAEKKNQLDIQRQVSQAARDEDLASLIALLDAGKKRPSAIPSEGDVRSQLGIVAQKTEAKLPGAVAVVAEPAKFKNSSRVCEASLAFYQSVLDLPRAQAGPMLRFLAADI